jgi:lipopolysaccharide/colanic/teichoic acid biosynthesis glycosyltransferase
MKSSQSICVDSGPCLEIPKWKRVLDVTCIVLALPFLVPVVFLIGLVIKIVSPGPVIFKQERIGYRARRFTCLKFRTMRVNAETASHQTHLYQLMASNSPMSKLDSAGDPRLIRFGSLLRASGLDELPQLFNVLCGDMSLVGPRPCVPYEFEQYLPDQRRRFNTLPGLTGLWQVSGKNRTTFSQMIDLDIHYTLHKSLWLDLKIIFKTIPAILLQCLEKRRRSQTRMRSSLSRQNPLRSCNSPKSICETVGTH